MKLLKKEKSQIVIEKYRKVCYVIENKSQIVRKEVIKEMSVVAERLISLRGEKTQRQVADAIGVSQSTYAMYETGKRVPSDEKKKKIAKYYDKSVQSIFFD